MQQATLAYAVQGCDILFAATLPLAIVCCAVLSCTEGQSRLFDVIRSAAETLEADRAGVWASFGQPYACLGQPQKVRDGQHITLIVNSGLQCQ